MAPPYLIVIFGLIATGKTTVAKALAAATGWMVIHSDVVRKVLAGIPPTQRVLVPYGQGIYQPEFSGRTYEEMFRQAGEYLAQGRNVILDGSFMRVADRQRARELAAAHQARLIFFLCTCPREIVQQRLRQRQENQGAISNGRQEILATQEQVFEPPEDLVGAAFYQLATDRPLSQIVKEALELLGLDSITMPGE